MSVSIIITGDQLLREHPALAAYPHARVLLIESTRKLRSLPFHQKKQVLLISALRHYADWLRTQGREVDVMQADSFGAAIRQHVERHGVSQLVTMAAVEYSARQAQDRWAERFGLPVEILPNTQFLIGTFDPFPDPDKRVILETFYRAMRKHFNVLMNGDEPVGGQWNFDHDNRKPLPKTANPPHVRGFPPDAITRQVMDEIRAAGHGVGAVEGFDYAVTHEDAARALKQFIRERLPDFGAYEDAMTTRHATLYHSVLSPYVNIGLLTPLQMIRAAEAAYHEGLAPINSVEGFIRQVIGWREYMAWQYRRQMPALVEKNGWSAHRPMPEFFWTGETSMNCLSHTLKTVNETAYAHHIQRLMLISNFCMLAGIAPQAVVEWFMAYFIDAYDWVMQTNVVGMGLNADGGITATKPYISSANYIHKMGDYCKSCAFDHTARHGERACPFNFLYWNFLIQHEQTLRANPRFGQAVLGLRHLTDEDRAAITRQAAEFLG